MDLVGERIKLPFALNNLLESDDQDFQGIVRLLGINNQRLDVSFMPLSMDLLHYNQGLSYYAVIPARIEETQHIEGDMDRFFLESPVGIAVISKTGEVLDKNSSFMSFLSALGVSRLNHVRDFVCEKDQSDFIHKIRAIIESGKAENINDITFKGNSEKSAQFYITRLANFQQHESIAIVYLIDTTEQKNLEMQFAQSQKMQAVGQLAGGIAHDFNNLLTAITGFCDLLLVRHGPGDHSFSDIIQIKQNANRAANLVRQLLAFSRQQTLRPKVLVVTDVLAELTNLLRRLIGENIELKMQHGRDMGTVKLDQGQLEQVIINLCVNARDAMPDGGTITLRTRQISREESIALSTRYQLMPPNEYVLLEVEDEGTGIAKEHIGQIFEPFFSTKEVGKGTGLGLSTVYGIVKQTGGFIFPKSEVDVGTTFSIYLPVHKSSDVKVDMISDLVEEEPAKDLTGKATILLVEDEDAVRMFASRALKNKGYNVYEANSGVSALEVMETMPEKIDLLISDVMMPQMDGPTLVAKIREDYPKLKVIFISGYAEDALDENIAREDFLFLPKPFSLKQLAEQVKDAIES